MHCAARHPASWGSGWQPGGPSLRGALPLWPKCYNGGIKKNNNFHHQRQTLSTYSELSTYIYQPDALNVHSSPEFFRRALPTNRAVKQDVFIGQTLSTHSAAKSYHSPPDAPDTLFSHTRFLQARMFFGNERRSGTKPTPSTGARAPLSPTPSRHARALVRARRELAPYFP